MIAPEFPPLFSGQEVDGDPAEAARRAAAEGCDAGLVTYTLGDTQMRAAIVFAPDVPLHQAAVMLPLCAVGFQNALGALAPPEVAVHLAWDGGIRINGAECGRLGMQASHTDPAALPDWLIISLDLPLWPDSDNPGETPDRTALYAEGCADVAPTTLLESWIKHTLVGINRWTDEGNAPLHREWSGLADGIGQATRREGLEGQFIGVDEDFGMLLSDDNGTHLIPLTTLLKAN